MGLEELADVLPDPGEPVDDPRQLCAAQHAAGDLLRHEAPLQEARQEPAHRLHVVRAEHPAKVVVQLKVVGRCRASLTHRTDDERSARLQK